MNEHRNGGNAVKGLSDIFNLFDVSADFLATLNPASPSVSSSAARGIPKSRVAQSQIRSPVTQEQQEQQQ